ncbi:hypothetical protein NX059_004041 [Plenodomus lindquistii]|nr:hypothetical protein NX059_004041 [Plenodomus lindquistii]
MRSAPPLPTQQEEAAARQSELNEALTRAREAVKVVYKIEQDHHAELLQQTVDHLNARLAEIEDLGMLVGLGAADFDGQEMQDRLPANSDSRLSVIVSIPSSHCCPWETNDSCHDVVRPHKRRRVEATSHTPSGRLVHMMVDVEVINLMSDGAEDYPGDTVPNTDTDGRVKWVCHVHDRGRRLCQ